jgi:outer membrane protein TolC
MKPKAIALVVMLCGVLTGFLGGVDCAWAQASQTPVLRLTLADAIERGLEASHRLAEWGAREEAARAIEDQRKAATRPQVALLAGYTRTNHVQEFGVPIPTGGFRVIYPDIPDNYRSRVDFQWPIYTAGRSTALVKAAAAEANAVAQDRDAARGDLKLEITRAYWSVITARASVDVVREALSRIGAHLTDVQNQLSVGLIPPSDVLSIVAQQARQQMLAIEAQNVLDSVSADFRRLVGLAIDSPFELADVMQPPPPPSRQVAALVDAARSNRAERRALEIRLEGASERVTAAAAGRKPMLTSAAGYDLARPNPRIFPRDAIWKPSWDLGINVSWPVFDGGRVRAEIAEASANRRASEERLKDFDANVTVEVQQRVSDLVSAEASIAAAEVGVKSAAEARRVLAERFSAGVATNTDVLDAQVALLQAELDRTRAQANAQLAAARLERALGR